LGSGGFLLEQPIPWSIAMSILDSLTDEGLKALIEVKNSEIAHLMFKVKFLEEERARLDKWSKAKSRRIVCLTLDLEEMRRSKCCK